jgi:hypothetical protein
MSPFLGPSLMKSAGAHVSRVHLALRSAARKGRRSLANHPLTLSAPAIVESIVAPVHRRRRPPHLLAWPTTALIGK